MPKDSKEREAPVNSMVVADINSDGVNEIIVRVRVALAALQRSRAASRACVSKCLGPFPILVAAVEAAPCCCFFCSCCCFPCATVVCIAKALYAFCCCTISP